VVIWQACRSEAWFDPRGGFPGGLGDVAVSLQARAWFQGVGILVEQVSSRASWVVIHVGHASGHSMWSWGLAWPEGWGTQRVGILVVCGSSEELGSWLEGWGSQQNVDPVIPHRAGSQQGLRGGGRACILHGAGARCGPRGGYPCGAWIWCGDGAWCSPRGRELGGAEQ
jgi:hypothetical protein